MIPAFKKHIIQKHKYSRIHNYQFYGNIMRSKERVATKIVLASALEIGHRQSLLEAGNH